MQVLIKRLEVDRDIRQISIFSSIAVFNIINIVSTPIYLSTSAIYILFQISLLLIVLSVT